MRKYPFAKNFRLILPVLVLLGVLVAAMFISRPDTATSGTCSEPYRTDETLTIEGKKFNVEVASDRAEMQNGLGGRECLGSNQAMLFVFSREGQYGFWMKDMKFPIDVIWISADKKIAAIEKNFTPDTYPENAVNEKDKPALYVLEVKAGTADELKLKLGDPVSF